MFYHYKTQTHTCYAKGGSTEWIFTNIPHHRLLYDVSDVLHRKLKFNVKFI